MTEQVFCGITPGHPPHDVGRDRICGGYPPSGYLQNPVMVTFGIQGEPGSKSHWFWCPGCVDTHRIQSPFWKWDGNEESPTFDPSIKVHPHLTLNDADEKVMTFLCHSFIRAGVWEFLDDCTHSLAGQKIKMVPVPDWLVRREGA